MIYLHKRTIFLFFYLLCFSSSGTLKSQSFNPDTLFPDLADTSWIQKTQKLAFKTCHSNPQLAYEMAVVTLDSSVRIDYHKGIAHAYNYMAISRATEGQLDSAKVFFLRSLTWFQKIDDYKSVASLHNNLGILYQKTGFMDSAIDHHFKALAIRDNLQNQKGIINSYNNIIGIYKDKGNLDVAMEYTDKALKLIDSLDIVTIDRAHILGNKGLILLKRNQFAEALGLFQQSLELFQQQDHDYGISHTHYSLGKTYSHLDSDEKALTHLQKALELKEKLRDVEGMSLVYLELGKLFYNNKHFSLADEHLKKSIEYAATHKYYKILQDAWLMNSKLDSARGDFAGAYAGLKKHHDLHDSLNSVEINRKISEIRTKYQTEKQQAEIELLKKERSILDLKVARQNLLTLLAGSLLLLSIVIILIFFRYLRKIKRLNTTLEEKNSEILGSREKINNQKMLLEQQKEELICQQAGLEEQVKERTKELEIAKNKAEESDRLKSAFLANMSHEIRTPMNGIIGFSEMFLKPNLTEEKRTYFANIIINSSKQLLTIVNDILDISKLESNALEISKSEVVINDLINELFAFYRPQANNKLLTVMPYKQLNDRESTIFADKLRLRQVLVNLLNNALKFTHKGTIRFGYKQNSGQLQFFVEDTGIGISKEYQEKIFERFSQEETEITRQYGGTGLGLAISKKLVHLMGGEIYVNSVKGEGATFYFNLPYEPVYKSAGELPVTEAGISSSPFTMLVADDEEINFLYLTELLSDKDILLLHAKDGKEAVNQTLENKTIDLVLMDIKMPVMNGLEATKEIKRTMPEMPVIAYTAYAMKEDREKIDDAGCDDFLSKPLDEKKLMKIISQYKGRKEADE